jgi:hypothetical protein
MVVVLSFPFPFWETKMTVSRIFIAAALTAALACQARGADSNGAELECRGQGKTNHAFVHIDFAPTKRVVLRDDAPTGLPSDFDVEDGRISSTNDGWFIAESVSISDEKITWRKERTCSNSTLGKCETGSIRVTLEGSVNRYTGKLTSKAILGLPLDLDCELLQKKF